MGVTAPSGQVAIHVCGSGARRELLEGDLADLTCHAPRARVNGRLTAGKVPRLAGRVTVLITHHNPGNVHLLQVGAPNHVVLLDSSGGRGLSPREWLCPRTRKPVGFAGDLGPDNLANEMPSITGVAKQGSRIDLRASRALTTRSPCNWRGSVPNCIVN